MDEYRTSTKCYNCGDRVSKNWKFRPRSKGIGAHGEAKRCHSVVRCNNNVCATCWDRDVNASLNILTVVEAMLAGNERPAGLRRGGGNAGGGAP